MGCGKQSRCDRWRQPARVSSIYTRVRWAPRSGAAGLEMIIAACCVSAVMDVGYLCGDELWIHLRRRRRLRELSSAVSAEYGRSYGIRLELLLKATVCCRLRRNPSGCGIHPLVRIDDSLHAQSASCCLRAPGLLAPTRSSQLIILRSINTHSQIAHAEACGSCASEPWSGAQARHARLWVDLGQHWKWSFVSDVVHS